MTRRFAREDRVPTDAMCAYYANRARHGVGLIITEGAVIDSTHAPPKRKEDAPGFVPGIFNDAQIAGWRHITEAVHAEGGAVAVQLWHTGRFGTEHALGPSDWSSDDGAYSCKKMTEDDIAGAIADFVTAAINAKNAGFDALEIHGAHGYLLSSFNDPHVNTRTDAYGGSFENRMRFALEVTAAVRKGVGKDFPIIVRFSQWAVDDYTRLVFEDASEIERFSKALIDAGADALHPSTRDCTAPAFDGSDETLAGIAKRAAGVPVIAVGRVTTSQTFGENQPPESTDPAPAIALLEHGDADILAVGRALITNADWCKKVRDGKWRELVPFELGVLGQLE